MNETKKTRETGAKRNCTCNDCGETFFSRKLRRKHQMLVHRKPAPVSKRKRRELKGHVPSKKTSQQEKAA